MSELISYPERKDLEWWIQYLQSEDRTLKLALPHVDAEWFEHVCAAIERAQMSYDVRSLHHKGAEIFYKIIKAHNYIDGNKRSGILVIYLFYLVNARMILPALNIKDLAKKVAASKGRSRYEWWIDCLEKEFRAHTVLLESIPQDK